MLQPEPLRNSITKHTLVCLALSTGFRDLGCMHVRGDMPGAYDGMRSMLRSQRHPYRQRLACRTTWPSLSCRTRIWYMAYLPWAVKSCGKTSVKSSIANLHYIMGSKATYVTTTKVSNA